MWANWRGKGSQSGWWAYRKKESWSSSSSSFVSSHQGASWAHFRRREKTTPEVFFKRHPAEKKQFFLSYARCKQDKKTNTEPKSWATNPTLPSFSLPSVFHRKWLTYLIQARSPPPQGVCWEGLGLRVKSKSGFSPCMYTYAEGLRFIPQDLPETMGGKCVLRNGFSKSKLWIFKNYLKKSAHFCRFSMRGKRRA